MTEAENTPNIAVLGVGNILFRDEGLGIYATQFLKDNYDFSPPIDLIDGGTIGMNLIHYYQSYDHLLLLDTISVDEEGEPGSVYCLPSEVLQGMGNYRRTAHEVEVLQTLELGALAGDVADIQVIAMVPEDMDSVSISLTDTVKQTLPLLIQTTLEQLEKLGVEVKQKISPVSLEQILRRYDQQQAPFHNVS
ncbi:HyaD/HybD family hydrogenase maturation endopeptidase [Thiomicrorhabdus sp. ZW0627]|uniref:HyaD/HybD family hydrogenase maturation endopeptidase n=1 Tax=Thiomicrorhabdus sp. ZW0627 TaxID=3039774 RepID=UPI002436DED8|nr:HyaD/HybD family hydrogenase maturation endopeptidase [Thiomicrorhabdus sp. ZW0627]MDG6774154.1 HyaD/HybD family hydrogenase maturation endopeptidase [Thiomicrorhabdus sp. ZW0627]